MNVRIILPRFAHGCLTCGLLTFAVVNSAFAQEVGWQADLRKQLLAEKDCELNYLTDSKTYELLGKQTIEVRAHCKDKRAFDAARSGDDKVFELKSCEVVTC